MLLLSTTNMSVIAAMIIYSRSGELFLKSKLVLLLIVLKK